jgi:hypothetical protein
MCTAPVWMAHPVDQLHRLRVLAGGLPITAIKAPSWIVLFRPIRSAVCPAIRAPTDAVSEVTGLHVISRTESSSCKDRDDSSGDTGIRVLEIGVEFIVTVGNHRTNDSRIVSEQKRPDGTDEISFNQSYCDNRGRTRRWQLCS